MNYSVIPIPKFKKEAKRLIKIYPSLKPELLELGSQLALNPSRNSLGINTYKSGLPYKIGIKVKVVEQE